MLGGQRRMTAFDPSGLSPRHEAKMPKKSMVVSNQTVIALTLRQCFIGMAAICGSLFMSCEMAYATDLIMSQEETQCIQHLTPGGNGAQSISVQCASIVFIADKDTSVIYMCSAIVGTNFNVQQGRFIGGLPPNGGFFCRRDIVPTPPHHSSAITWPKNPIDMADVHGGQLIPNMAESSWNIDQSLNLQYCVTIDGLPPIVPFAQDFCKTDPFVP
jgi:hypothetical protein